MIKSPCKKQRQKVSRRSHLKHYTKTLLSAIVLVSFISNHAMTQSAIIPIIRDSEIEQLVADYAAPILKVAGFKSKNIQIAIVNDQSFNAFVSGQKIFINTGVFITAQTPNEVIGVLAHEIGHLAGGHQPHLRNLLESAQNIALIGTLIGLGTSIAGMAGGSGTATSAGSGVAAGSVEMATRMVLHYKRGEEEAADQSAMQYLERTKQSAQGMLTTFEQFANALAFSGARIDPYRISHPLPRERIASLKMLASKSPYFRQKDSHELQHRHDMARAKVAAYTRQISNLHHMFKQNPQGLPARYGETILAANKGAPAIALTKVKALIAKQPANPFFYELYGDILIRANNPSLAAEAYKRAVELDKHSSSLLRINYGHALLLTNIPEKTAQAADELQTAITYEPHFSQGYSYLAMAYGRMGKTARANLAIADMHYYSGDIAQARFFALRAQRGFKHGSGHWLRAQDILYATQQDAQ